MAEENQGVAVDPSYVITSQRNRLDQQAHEIVMLEAYIAQQGEVNEILRQEVVRLNDEASAGVAEQGSDEIRTEREVLEAASVSK